VIQNVENGWFAVVQSRSLETVPFDKAHTSSYYVILTFHSDYVPNLHRFYHAMLCWFVICCHRVSVCPMSITNQHCTKTAKHTITHKAQNDSTKNPFFLVPNVSAKFQQGRQVDMG